MSENSIMDLGNKNICDEDEIFNELSEFSHEIKEIDLSNNQLELLPDDLSLFKNLIKINLINNPFKDFNKVIKSLSTIPNLQDLNISLIGDNYITVVSSLNNLKILNGKKIDQEDDIESIKFEDEIDNFNIIFNRINDKLKSAGVKDSINSFNDIFNKTIQNEIKKLNELVYDNSNHLNGANIIMSKISVYSFFQNKLLKILQIKDNSSVGILSDTYKSILNCTEGFMSIIINLNKKLQDKNELYSKAIKDINSQVYIDKIHELEKKLEDCEKQKDIMNKHNVDEKKFLNDKIKKLELENKVITDKLLRKVKDISYTTSEKLETKPKTSNITSKNLTKNMLIDIINSIYDSKILNDKINLEYKVAKETMEQHMYTYLNKKYGLKNLTIEWASGIINGIRKFSSEDSDVLLFGKILRNEIEEEAVSVIAKLKVTIVDLLSYILKSKNPLKSNGDIKKLVNSKMTGNLLEDEWRSILYSIYEKEDTILIENKVNEIIKKKYMDNDLLAFFTNNDVKKISRDEIEKIDKIKDEMKIPFSEFFKIILDFQIMSRDKYLKPFTIIFRKADLDKDGILNEEDLMELLTYTECYKDNIKDQAKKIFNTLDQNNNKSFTFSDLVNYFSKEMIEFTYEEGKKLELSVLDKLSNY